jgi:UDP-glucose 4-epimerase
MIGAHLFAALRATGKPVLALSRAPAEANLASEVRLLPSPDAPAAAFEAALAGASHVVHCAALNSDAGGAGEEDFFAANATLTAKLASAASRTAPGRFIFLSSTRAVVDGEETTVLDEETPCRPTSPYGRSKLEGERRLKAAYDTARRSGAVVLRLPPVYGPGMRGQLGALLRLADTPLPLPLKAYGSPRSLASCRSVVQAVMFLLDHEWPIETPCLVADGTSVNVGDILFAFRKGLSRPQRLFAVPERLLRVLAAVALQARTARLLAAGQILRPERLPECGWTPEPDTGAALADLAARVSRSPATARRS